VLPVLIALFIGVPFAEIYVLLQVGDAIGVVNTLGLLILISVVGAWLAKREGLGVLRRMQRSIDSGRVPGTEIVDGFLILLAGALEGSIFRTLRQGQRVVFELDESDRATRLRTGAEPDLGMGSVQLQ